MGGIKTGLVIVGSEFPAASLAQRVREVFSGLFPSALSVTEEHALHHHPY